MLGETREIELGAIAPPSQRLRKLRPEVVDQLAESILEQGLLQPILVRDEGSGFVLVAGLHRFAAVVKLNMPTIRAAIFAGSADAAQLAEIDENLARADLSPAEQALHIGARKALYERLHPETRHGGAPGKAGGGKKAKGDKLSSFAQQTATAIGKNQRTVQRTAARAKKIAPEVLASVAGTAIDKGEELDALAKLPADKQAEIAEKVAAGSKVSVAQQAKKMRRADREKELAARTEAASSTLGAARYGVIYADPPWRFEPYSRDTGMDRSADNHYPTMTLDAIKALRVPAAEDAVLFLWATIPMLPQALEVMTAWGFAYKSHFVWVKDKIGPGYWAREKHELLLIGTRGKIPAPAPGEQFPSVVAAPRGRHSAKPFCFCEMIEEMFPTLPRIELFARGEAVGGWASWGIE